ncbi:MAG: TonB-dependent receptor [Bacteroidales bacterium]|nr:TonB-dependent receptor [Bacteroidales bacterium]
MRRLVLLIFAAIVFIQNLAYAQQATVYRNIGIDSLVSIFRRISSQPVYYIPSPSADNLIFTVNGGSATLEEDIMAALTEKGYLFSRAHNSIFILKGAGLTAELPSGYFKNDVVVETRSQQDYIDILQDNANVATSQNKVYQIGDKERQNPQGKAYLSGFVRDSRTGEPVVGVLLYDSKTKAMAQSDAYGFYKILLPLGENILDVTGYSLEDSKVNLMVYNEGVLDVVVKERVFSLNSVVVSAENSSKLRNNEIGIEKVRMERIKKVPAVFGEADVVKVILTLPGVKSVGEASGGFNVRGGATDQNLVLFNGGTVYNPSHLFGMFSSFNPDIVNDIELYKSSIPVEYGGRISSVLDVRSREGNNKNVTGSLGVGLLTARAHLEGPVGKKTTFIVGARGTYSDWLLGLLPEESGYKNGTASFYDVTAGLTHRFNERNSIHLNGYYSTDAFKFSVDTSYRYENLNASLRWKNNFHEKHSFEFNAGYDKYGYSTFDKYNPVSSYELAFDIWQGFGKLKFNSLLNNRHSLTYGLEGVYYNLSPGSYLPYGEESKVKPKLLDTETAVEAAVYVSDSWKISEKLFLDYGIRMTAFKSDKVYAAPEIRVSGRYMISPKVSFKAGFNSMNQYIHMLSNTTAISPTDTWKLSDKDIKPQTGWQAAAGFYASMANNKLEMSVEGYYKNMEHYLDYKSGAVIIMNENIANDVVETQGKAYGVEVMFKKPIGKLNGWMSYTYSRAQLRESSERGGSAINGGEWYNASFDKPHDFKLVGNYKFTHRFSISLNADYSTGRPVSIPIAKYYYGGAYRLYYSQRNSYRIPDYFRLDAAINVEPTHKLKAFTHFSFTLGVYNVTGRKNVYSVYFESEGPGNIKGYKLSVFGSQIPYINLNFKF